MRIKLLKGKQRELISKAKGDKTWRKLGNELGICGTYLRVDLFRENRLLDSRIFEKLCEIANRDFSLFIEKKLNNNWGRIKGGINSPGRTKNIKKPIKNQNLAELIGIIQGDGSMYWNNKRGVYALKIAGDLKHEKEYHTNFVKPLIDRIFQINSKIEVKKNERFVTVYSRQIIERLEEVGLRRGNKKKNNIGIPNWIKNNDEFLKVSIRGLIDTDGSVFRMSKKDPCLLRISFKNKSQKLLIDVQNGLISLGFSPTKIISNDHFFISKKADIRKYLNEINFALLTPVTDL